MTLNVKMVSCLGIAIGMLVTVSAHAAPPVCNSVAECQQLINAAQAQILAFQPVVQLGPIVKTTDGKPLSMTQYDAQKYCESAGKRLPTVKELVLALNPKGFHTVPVDGIPLSRIYKQDGSIDFYYNYTTYALPESDVKNHWFWSSSVHPTYDYWVYNFDGHDGAIKYYSRSYSDYGAVICVGR